jgi:hypothetical protein
MRDPDDKRSVQFLQQARFPESVEDKKDGFPLITFL